MSRFVLNFFTVISCLLGAELCVLVLSSTVFDIVYSVNTKIPDSSSSHLLSGKKEIRENNLKAFSIYPKGDSLYIYADNFVDGSHYLGATSWKNVKGIDSLISKNIQDNK